MNNYLPFLFPDKFHTLPVTPNFVYSPPNIPAPDQAPNSPLSSFQRFKDFPDFLKDMYMLHISNNNSKLYLESNISNETFLYDISQLSQISHLIIPTELLIKTANLSSLTDETMFQFFTPEQSYALIHIIYHFRALAETENLYTTPDLRKRLFSKLLYFLTPASIIWTSDFPIVSMMKVESKVSIFKKKANAIVNFVSSNQIIVSPDPTFSQTEHGTLINFTFETAKIIVHLVESNSDIVLITSTPNLLRDSIRARPPIIFPFSESIVSSFSAIPPNEEINVHLIDSFCKMIMTLDYNFTMNLFDVIDTDAQNGKNAMSALNVIYSIFHQRLRLMKYLSYYEVKMQQETPNQIFRGNRQTILLLTELINEELCDFLKVTIATAFVEISQATSFDEKNIVPEDADTVDKLLTLFWEIVIPAIDQMPSIIRSILRYHRFICETILCSQEMNQRALSGLFMLRVIVPAFTSLKKVGLEADAVDPAGIKKCQSFSKILMALSTLGSEYSAVVSAFSLFNPVLEKHASNMINFFEKVTEPVYDDLSECKFTLQDLSRAVQTMRSFISTNGEAIKAKASSEFHPSIFLNEIVHCIKIPKSSQ